jgi:DNA mismatch repair ATPase MutS
MNEEPMLNNESIKSIIQACGFLKDEVKQLREEKKAMLKHITDFETALTELNNDWLAGNDMDEAFTEHLSKFSYLRAQSEEIHGMQQDDGYEPPEHMTADDFNEMHSGPFQPDDSGYMDGDE